ncbi:hypothetical protein PoB_006196700 [Plakobranchus ocellatus]|uniref:Uncharacterized protein n=1 Tax=Plakobranchus ocellatus TaxID=259542 RepID=A0AAV4CU80_9GAST|nr:hypothetical protein PoB_006196700 [Plakobranchus ocellatus]
METQKQILHFVHFECYHSVRILVGWRGGVVGWSEAATGVQAKELKTSTSCCSNLALAARKNRGISTHRLVMNVLRVLRCVLSSYVEMEDMICFPSQDL